MKKTGGNSKNTGKVPAVRPGTTVSTAITSSDVAEFDYSALGGKKSKSKSAGAKKPAAKKTASNSSTKKKSTKKSSGKGKGKAIAAVAAAVICLLVVVGGALYLTGYAKPVIDLFKPKIEVTLADGTVVEMTVDDARAELANTRLDSEQSKSERTNIADKSGKQTNEEKRRRNRR